MKNKWRVFLSGIVIATLFLTPRAWPGQVVTEKERDWARKALKSEKALSPLTGEKTVAVLYFSNGTGNPDLDPFQKGITIMLITDLAKIETLTLVERTKIQALLDEMALSQAGIMDRAAAPKTGRLLGAGVVVGGDFLTGKESRIQISSDILTVSRPKAIEKVFSEGLFQELLTLEKELAFKIVKKLDIQLTPKEIAALKKPLSKNMRALGYLFSGIDLSDKGKYQAAKRYYEKAFSLDPGLTAAQEAITELLNHELAPTPSKAASILNTTQNRTSTIRDQGFDKRLKSPVMEPITRSETSDIHVKW